MTQVPATLDHVLEVLQRIPPRYWLGDYGRIAKILARPLNDLETAIEDVARAYALLDSSTPLFALQAIARRFGLVLPKDAVFGKPDYRIFIRAQAAAILSSGTWPQVYRVASLLRSDDIRAPARVFPLPPDHMQIDVPGMPDSYGPIAKQILRQAVRAQDTFDLVTYPDDDVFTLDLGPGLDVGKLAKIL